jgi:hypothetical protein
LSSSSEGNPSIDDAVVSRIQRAKDDLQRAPEQQDDPASWQEITYKHVSKVHSLTVADIDGARLTIRQLTADAEEVDRFVITK